MGRVGPALPLALGLAMFASPARACVTCNCGDPTLTATGLEKPYKNRVRLAIEARAGWFRVGNESVGGEEAWFLRTTIAATWSATSRLTLALSLPWVTSWVSPFSRNSQETISGLGDLETSARVVVARDRSFAPHHLLWLVGGLKMPTGPRLRDGSNHPFADDDQPGSESWDPFLGATYGWFSGSLASVFASASYRLTTPGPRGYRRGSTLGYSAGVQLQPVDWGAIVVGADGVWSQPDTLPNGVAAPNTGGAIVGFAPAFLLAPAVDWLIRLQVEVPIVQVLNGVQRQGSQVMLSIAYDIR